MATKKSTSKGGTKKSTSRPKPLTPKAGFKANGARYGRGGKLGK